MEVEGVVTGGDEAIVPTGHALAEAVLTVQLGPAYLGYGCYARVHHIFVVLVGGDLFGPEVTLDT